MPVTCFTHRGTPLATVRVLTPTLYEASFVPIWSTARRKGFCSNISFNGCMLVWRDTSRHAPYRALQHRFGARQRGFSPDSKGIPPISFNTVCQSIFKRSERRNFKRRRGEHPAFAPFFQRLHEARLSTPIVSQSACTDRPRASVHTSGESWLAECTTSPGIQTSVSCPATMRNACCRPLQKPIAVNRMA